MTGVARGSATNDEYNENVLRRRLCEASTLQKSFSIDTEDSACQWRSCSSPPFRTETGFQEQPRQLLLGAIIILGVVLIGSIWPLDADSAKRVLICRCIMASIWVTSMYFMMQMRDSPLIWPHPAFFRWIQGLVVWYLVMMSVCAILPITLVRDGLQVIYPDIAGDDTSVLGNWHLDCAMTPEVFYTHLRSVWFFAHVTGWTLKMVLCRNWMMCLIFSTFCEFMELTLQYIIPEFQECWWDSILLDWAGANILGMALGQLLLKFFQAKEFPWGPMEEVGDKKHKWWHYRWNEHQLIEQYCCQWSFVIVATQAEVNCFLLMQTLRMPPTHHVNVLRCLLIFCVSLPTSHEWHLYTVGEESRIGYSTWSILMVVALEMVVFWRYASADGVFLVGKLPWDVVAPWIAFCILQLVYSLCHWKQQTACLRAGRQWKMPQSLRAMRFCSFLPLFYLLRSFAN